MNTKHANIMYNSLIMSSWNLIANEMIMIAQDC